MSSAAILLILASAVTHVAWNLLGKQQNPTPWFFLAANMAGVLVGIPVAAVFAEDFGTVLRESWSFLFVSGFFQALYFLGLSGAYRSGEMSIAYPLARSLPVVLVALATVLLGKADELSAQCGVGIALVLFGSMVLPMRTFNEFNWGHYWNRSCAFAVLAAIGTAGYTMLDDAGLRAWRIAVDERSGSVGGPIVYLLLLGISSSIWLAALASITNRGDIQSIKQIRLRHAAATGAGIYVTYALVLMSLSLVANVSYVAAFRQVSIPLGAILGVTLLHEGRYAPKFAGVSLMFVGLMLVATG